MIERKAHLDLFAMTVLLLLCACWGLQQVAIKVASEVVPPFLQAGLRSLGATLLILLWMGLRGIPLWQRDGSGGWGLLTGLLFAGEFLLVYWGLEYTHASRAVIFLYFTPFVVAVGCHFFVAGEQLRWGQVFGLLCSFSGILLAFGESFGLPSNRMLIGDGMLLLAALFWGATTVVIKASVLHTLSPSKVLLYQLAVSAVLLLGAALASGERLTGELTPLVIGSLLFQTVWIAFVTYLIWFWLIRHYPAGRLSSFTFLTPIYGVLAGHLLLDEPLTGLLLGALLLVGSGIYLVNRPERRSPAVVPNPSAD